MSTGSDIPSFPMLALYPLPLRPTVSVLISSYNYGRFLGKAIDSALRQSFRPLEVIVSDDGSDDDSCEIVEAYARRGDPVVLVQGSHRGMAGSLNAAFSVSSGEILCLLDADDYFAPEKISLVVSALRNSPDAGFAIHRTQRIDDRGRQVGVYPLLNRLPVGDCSAVTLHNSGILMGLPPTSSLSLRREVAEQIFPIPEYYRGYAEQMIHRLAPLLTSVCAVDEALSVWRLHGRNDANSAHVTAGRLERELTYMRRLWSEQYSFLLSRAPHLADQLPPLEANALFLKMVYVRMKLMNDPAARQFHSALCDLPELRAPTVRAFWRCSIWLPGPVFRKCLDLLETQSVWKECIAVVLHRKSRFKEPAVVS
ncbi:MAG TPA: glycosyltransferase family A protein [Acidobacteriaceae bacterium]|jgi:glycosyltransferase involved in cell wall biosynthesis|nr:glycosyltransferase family A protein [Acidobacteriaceae bacterium]